MVLEADLVQKEIDPPFNRWCSCGHEAPAMFRRGGAGTPEEPTKFFLITGKNINSIYCEPCLIVAHYISQQLKKIIE